MKKLLMKMLCIPFKVFFVISLVILVIEAPSQCLAKSYVINPSDDGSIYDNGNVVTHAYLLCSGYIRGVVEFPIGAINEQIETSTLSVNPYGLPLWDKSVHVYGYSSTDGRLTSSDYNAGVFLGDWVLPNLGYGKDAYFDVTSFMKTVTTTYVGFNLRTEGTDVFSSLEYNYGHPSQLSVVTVPELQVAVDIKPGSCPNPLNVKSKGILPVAILGSEDFDVNDIDVASIRLTGIAPIRSSFEDVAKPVTDTNDCNCTEDGPDGYLDLTLKFKTQEIVNAIGDVNDGDVLVLQLTGVLFNERPIEGADCVIIRGKHKPLNKADFTCDGKVDMADFATFAENWLQSSIVQD